MSGDNGNGYSLDRLLTIPQLSERINVPVATIRDWIHMRYIPFVKLGRRIYFDMEVVNDWINGKASPGRLTRHVTRV